MKLTYFGHSACMIETEGNTVLIDPFITGNPHAQEAGIESDAVQADFILLTHGHQDHLGDSEAIAKRTDALIVTTFELASYLEAKGCRVHPMGIGGAREFGFGRVKFTLAHHSSSIMGDDGKPIYLGNPAGLLLTIEGKKIYHAGDTALFSEMQWLGDRHTIELALLPVGDNFTMGPDDAVDAIRMIKPKRVIPIHYNTFPPIQIDVDAFAEQAGSTGASIHVLSGGDALEI